MLKEGYYKCTKADYRVITKMYGRIPEEEPYTLEKGQLYLVDSLGRLQIPHKGCAKIDETIESILEPYESDENQKEWGDLRNQAAIAAMQGMITLQNPHGVPNYDRIAEFSVKAADALIKQLKQ